MSEKEAELHHDWLLAQFEVLAGAILTGILATLIAAITNQISGLAAIELVVILTLSLVLVWWFAREESKKVRASLNPGMDHKELD